MPLYEQHGTYHHNMTTCYGLSWSQVITLLGDMCENVFVFERGHKQWQYWPDDTTLLGSGADVGKHSKAEQWRKVIYALSKNCQGNI